MPDFDGTGPGGKGSGTGCCCGPCCFGVGWRRRHSRGRGIGHYFGWKWPQTKKEEKKALLEYQKALKEELEDVEKEMEELK